MSFLPGEPSMTTFVAGKAKASGIRSCKRYAWRCAKNRGEILNRARLLPLKGGFPRMTLVWGDSHYGGNFILWMLIHMRWRMETIKALTMPKENSRLTQSEQKKEDKPSPSTFRPLPRRWVVERTI